MALSWSQESRGVVISPFMSFSSADSVHASKRPNVTLFPVLVSPTCFSLRSTMELPTYDIPGIGCVEQYSVHRHRSYRDAQRVRHRFFIAQRCPRVISSRRTTAFWESGAPPPRRRFPSELNTKTTYDLAWFKYNDSLNININIKIIITFPNRSVYRCSKDCHNSQLTTEGHVVLPVDCSC